MNHLVKTQLCPIILNEKVCSWTDVTQGNWGFLLPVMKCENECSFSFHHDKHQWQCNGADPFLWTVLKFFSPMHSTWPSWLIFYGISRSQFLCLFELTLCFCTDMKQDSNDIKWNFHYKAYWNELESEKWIPKIIFYFTDWRVGAFTIFDLRYIRHDRRTGRVVSPGDSRVEAAADHRWRGGISKVPLNSKFLWNLCQIPIISCLKCTVNLNTVNLKSHQFEVYLTVI